MRRVEEAPDEATRRGVTAEFLTFLKRYELEGRKRAVWLMFASYFAGQLAGTERRDLLDGFAASGDATLVAYATLQREGINVLGLYEPESK